MEKTLDSSVAVKIFLRENESKKATALLLSAIQQNINFICPSIIVYEVNQAFMRKPLKPKTIQKKITEFMELIDDGILNVINPNAQLLKDAQHIAKIVTPPKRRPWSYDATFHALAVRENNQLVTADYNYIKRFNILIKDENDPEKLDELKRLRQHLIGLRDINI